MARELIAQNQSMCHSLSLVYQQILPRHHHQLFQHHQRQDSVFDIGKYFENPAAERSGSTSEELRGNPLHKPSK